MTYNTCTYFEAYFRYLAQFGIYLTNNRQTKWLSETKFTKFLCPRIHAFTEAKDTGDEQDLSCTLPVAHWSLCGFWSFVPQVISLLQGVGKYFVVCGDPSGLNNCFTLLSVTIEAWTYGPFQCCDSRNFVFTFNRVDLKGWIVIPCWGCYAWTLVNTEASLFSDFLWCCTVLLQDCV